MYKAYFVFFLSFISLSILAQQSAENPLLAANQTVQQVWVQQLYDSLSINQKIGQLLGLQLTSDTTSDAFDFLKVQQDSIFIGTVFFDHIEYKTKDSLIAELNDGLSVPLLTGLVSMPNFSNAKILAAVEDDALVQKTALQIARSSKRTGVHINFIPKIPVSKITTASLTNENYTLKDIRLAKTFISAYRSQGILSAGKIDIEIPQEKFAVSDSLKIEVFSLMPYEFVVLNYYSELIKGGIAAISTAFDIPNSPSANLYEIAPDWSLGKLTNILKEKLGFNGLFISECLPSHENALEMFLAGNDILRVSSGGNIRAAFHEIKAAYETGVISDKRLEYSVKKVLMAKYKVGLNSLNPKSASLRAVKNNQIENQLITEEVAENAIVLIKNDLDLVPVRNLDIKKIAYVSMGGGSNAVFLETMKLYTQVDFINANMLDELLEKLQQYNLVVIGLHPTAEHWGKTNKFSAKEKTWLYEISRRHNVILSLFTDPEELSNLASVANTETILVNYENSAVFQEKSAQLIFGAIRARGILPVHANDEFRKGTGLKTNSLSRLAYGLPESVGIKSSRLKDIDSVVLSAISSEVIPGAQVLVARKGRVVYHKSFGKTSYQNGDAITNKHLYDLASLTKILATLPMVMKLVEQGKLSLQSPLKEFYVPARGTNKKDITLLEMLTHYGRLKPWIPFYLYTLDPKTGNPSSKFYNDKAKEKFNTKVIGNLYIRDDYKDSIRQRILETDLRKKKEYRYSDLPYYILKEVIEQKFGNTLDNLTKNNIYSTIGANNTTFNPLEKFQRNLLVPSEKDTYFRHQIVQGYVHDMGAAMQGGVGGHAGLFSNANDIAKIMQMYLWDGYYGGKRYFKTGTIDLFNKCYFCESDNRRGVGFDKPQLANKGPTCGCVSMKSFGHSGFTGTYTWADPEKELVYVFLSNRTFPTSENRKLIDEGTRTVIQQIIYDAITE